MVKRMSKTEALRKLSEARAKILKVYGAENNKYISPREFMNASEMLIKLEKRIKKM